MRTILLSTEHRESKRRFNGAFRVCTHDYIYGFRPGGPLTTVLDALATGTLKIGQSRERMWREFIFLNKDLPPPKIYADIDNTILSDLSIKS